MHTHVSDIVMHNIFLAFLDFQVWVGANLHNGHLEYWAQSLRCTDILHAPLEWNTHSHNSHSGYRNLFGNSWWCCVRMLYFSLIVNLKTQGATWKRWVSHWLVEMVYHLDIYWGFCHWLDVNIQHLFSSVLVYLLYNPECVVSVEYMLQKNWYPWLNPVEMDKSKFFQYRKLQMGGGG